MSRLIGLARKLRDEQVAATAAEYVLMAVLVGVACLAAVTAFGESLAGLFRGAIGGLG